LTRSELKDLPHIKPEKGPTSLRSAWHRRHLITGGAVLEYGPTEILSPVSPMLPRPVCLCRPRRSSRLGRRGKPWLLDLERRIPARDRFAPDSPLEGAGFEPSVPLGHASWPGTRPLTERRANSMSRRRSAGTPASSRSPGRHMSRRRGHRSVRRRLDGSRGAQRPWPRLHRKDE